MVSALSPLNVRFLPLVSNLQPAAEYTITFIWRVLSQQRGNATYARITYIAFFHNTVNYFTP